LVDTVESCAENITSNKTFIAISENVETIRDVVKAVNQGNYSEAT